MLLFSTKEKKRENVLLQEWTHRGTIQLQSALDIVSAKKIREESYPVIETELFSHNLVFIDKSSPQCQYLMICAVGL